jgi:hypothetical protein
MNEEGENKIKCINKELASLKALLAKSFSCLNATSASIDIFASINSNYALKKKK